MPLIIARCLRAVAEAVLAYGRIYIPPFVQDTVPSDPGPDASPAAGPPPGHPERVTPRVPLTEIEWALSRELPPWPGPGAPAHPRRGGAG